MLRLKKYTGTEKADFYIQSHGEHAGRPLKEPIRNCYAVWTDTLYAYEICTCLFIAKRYQYFLIGSCVQFVRLREVQQFLQEEFSKNYKAENLQQLQNAMALHERQKQVLKKVNQLITAFAQSVAYHSK